MIKKDKENKKEILILVSLVAIYAALLGTIRWITFETPEIILFGRLFSNETLRGILTQLQLMVSILLVLKESKHGFILAVFVNFMSFLTATLYSLIHQELSPLPGILSYFSTILIVLLIYNYKRKVCSRVKRIEDQKLEVEKLAYFDELTGAMSRRKFMQTLRDAMVRCEKNKARLFVVFVDIDNFKSINDTLGHHTGDLVLRELTNRLVNKLNVYDYIGRLGGDEIGLICERTCTEEEFRIYLEGLKNSIIQPYSVDQVELIVTASFGASAYPDYANGPEEILREADLAMYNSKRRGKNKISFSSEIVSV